MRSRELLPSPELLLASVLATAMFAASALYASRKKQEEADLQVFEATLSKMKEEFPDALSNAELNTMVTEKLKECGCDEDKTLLATSLCCDEVNRPLEKSLGSLFGSNHSMGGLAGFPFGGVSSLTAIAEHIPDGGNCLIVFGPHVGVDLDGNVGTVNRRGREKGGSCCGSGVAAAGYVASVTSGELQKSDAPTTPLDAQQAYVGNMLLPHAQRLEAAADKMAELPYALFDAQDELMKEIVAKGAGNVEGDGKILVLGGIQINTPAGCSDYFLPLRFDAIDSEGQVTKELYQVPGRAAISKVAVSFPGAMTNAALVNDLTTTLYPRGYSKETSLCATSLCSDEVNRPLEQALGTAFGDPFSMGGAAGFAFGGVTSFGAMAHHIPDGGSCLVVYGPHVGIDKDGKVGTITHRGCSKASPCCGHGISAAVYVDGVRQGGVPLDPPSGPVDAQQNFLGKMLLPYAERLENAMEPMVELPYALFEAQDDLMQEILKKHFLAKKVVGKLSPSRRKIATSFSAETFAVMGGIQINTPEGASDYFLPLKFELLDNTGEVIEDLLSDR